MVSHGFQVDHITAVVSDADDAAAALSRLFGIEPCASLELPSMAIRSFRIGDAEIHVNAPCGPGIVRDHYAGHGPSIHHLALRVEDLETSLEELSRKGFRSLGSPIETVPGVREVFLDPTTTAGLWIQLVQRNGVIANDFDASAVEALASSATSARRKSK
jgi:methylmalonyl-CoA/ethylmalonyl-CoA epimerase